MKEQDLTDMADRVGMALGKELGGRFNVLANLRKEQEAGAEFRTIEIVDRWSDQSVTLKIWPEVTTAAHRNEVD